MWLTLGPNIHSGVFCVSAQSGICHSEDVFVCVINGEFSNVYVGHANSAAIVPIRVLSKLLLSVHVCV
jgi:hypothetical protein